jgi:hypothetical protein
MEGNRMKSKTSMKLETRLRHLSTEDVQRIIDRLLGDGTYAKLVAALDSEIAANVAMIRKGTTIAGAQEIADKRLRLALEMQESQKYRKTKMGKLESDYLPMIHHLRSTGMSWPSIVRQLKIRHRFTVSVPYLCRIYDGWHKRLEDLAD